MQVTVVYEVLVSNSYLTALQLLPLYATERDNQSKMKITKKVGTNFAWQQAKNAMSQYRGISILELGLKAVFLAEFVNSSAP